MSTRYKFVDNKAMYFTTSTVVGWQDVFTREIYKTVLLDSIRHCQLNQGLKIHAWVLMTNHLHTICSCNEGKDLGLIWRNIKSFTAMKLIDAITTIPKKAERNICFMYLKKQVKKAAVISGTSFGNMRIIRCCCKLPKCIINV
jgi:putative transposase